MKFKILALLILISIAGCQFFDKKPKPVDKNLEIEQKSLNYLITNELSAFNHSGLIRRQSEKFLEQWGMTGMSMAIIKDEKLVFAHGYGFCDKENAIPMQAGNILRIASVSKLITAVAILKLVESGKLRLDSKVFGSDAILNDSIFNSVKDKRLYDITVRQLLAHSGGWSLRYGDPAFNSLQIAELVEDDPPATIRTFYKFITSRRLHYTPGTRSSYSNMGYIFLGEVISKVSGKPFEEYIRSEIMIPNGIYDMHIGSSTPEGRRKNEVKYYESGDSQYIPDFEGEGDTVPKIYGGNPIELLGSAGGWVASTIELAKLMVLIDGHKKVKDILPDYLLSEMTRDGLGKGPLGWKTVSKDNNWVRTGSMAGTSAIIKRQNDGTTWIVVLNSSCWKGSLFPNEVNRFMQKLFQKVKEWPKQDLFQYTPSKKPDSK